MLPSPSHRRFVYAPTSRSRRDDCSSVVVLSQPSADTYRSFLLLLLGGAISLTSQMLYDAFRIRTIRSSTG